MNPTEAVATLRALGWRCEPPEGAGAATLAPESEAPVAPPHAPRVGQLWVPTYGAPRTVTGADDGAIWYRAPDLLGEGNVGLGGWHAWVRRSGARVVA